MRLGEIIQDVIRAKQEWSKIDLEGERKKEDNKGRF